MVIQFICRGNAFRSIIAEAYLKSLRLDNTEVISSGSVAATHKQANEQHYQQTLELLKNHELLKFTHTDFANQLTQERLNRSDLVIVMNKHVFDDCPDTYVLPRESRIWSIDDIGEGKHLTKTEEDRTLYIEEVFSEITAAVDELVASLTKRI